MDGKRRRALRNTIVSAVLVWMGFTGTSGTFIEAPMASTLGDAVWASLTNTTANGSTITKTTGADDLFNAGGLSQQALSGNGWVQFAAPSSVAHKVVVGLDTDPTTNYQMPFSLSFPMTNVVEVREEGIYRADTAWQPGDVFQIEIFDTNRVRYKKNGSVFYTSTQNASLPLNLDVGIATLNAGIANAVVEQQSVGPFWTNMINTTPNGTALTKTSGADDLFNAGALAQQTLSGNGWVQFTAPTSVTHKVVAGLDTDPTTNHQMPFSLSFPAINVVEVREESVYRADVPWQPGDVFQIEVFDTNRVRYKKNGAVFYTSTAIATLPLQLDVSIATLNAGISGVSFSSGGGQEPGPNAPQTYDLRTDTFVVPRPASPPVIGPAGSSVVDPNFGTRTVRITDATTAVDGKSWGTPSAPNLNAVSSDDTKFFAVGEDGSTALIYNFDPVTGAFSPHHEAFFLQEPTFSRRLEKPHVLYAPHYNYTVVSYDIDTRQRTTLITLTDEVGPMSQANGQYLSVVYSSQGTPERAAIAYGGVQETHPYMTVFDVDNPSNRITVNTRTSQIRVNGGAWQVLLAAQGSAANINFGIHSISIDRSGKWVKFDVSGQQGGPSHTAFLNVETRRIHEWTSNAWLGHYSVGWEAHVSAIADPNGGGTFQWLFTDLRQPGLPPPWRALITPPPPANNQLTTDHSNWNNARADLLVPVVSGTQRALGNNDWLRWFDEIVAVSTTPNAPALVYRAAHHHVWLYDSAGNQTYIFRDEPRPQVTHGGMWTFFTSNWGLTLGTHGTGTKNHRRDLFLVRMARE